MKVIDGGSGIDDSIGNNTDNDTDNNFGKESERKMQLAAKPDRLFLVGLMGVGKTTIGKLLAGELGLDFIDCDQELERRAGASIAWIFDVEGEAGFRARESRLLDELTNRNGVLLATGGGAVTRSQNRSYLIERGLVVYLDASLDLLVERTAKDKKRPLLQVADPRQALADLKKERDPLYRQIADTRVRVQNHGGKQAVAQILAALADDGYVTD